jgi:polyisoprenyl-phosphate glycosyltransferase
MFSIIIPAYNEEKAIIDTINRCKQVIESIGDNKSEIIVIDDSSSDSTYSLAKETGIKVILHPHNIGYGRSIKDGIIAANNNIIVITDADGTYPIEKIPLLLDEYKKGFNMVVGARQGKHYYESFYKSINRKILKKIVEFTAGRKIDDINSGLRIFSRSDALIYLDRLCNRFSFITSITLAYMMTGKFVKYIPIEYNKRVGETKIRLFKDSLVTLQFVIEANLFYNPIKIFTFFSFNLMLIGFICLGINIFLHLLSLYILGFGFIFIAILMFGFGLLATLLKQILQNTIQNRH